MNRLCFVFVICLYASHFLDDIFRKHLKITFPKGIVQVPAGINVALADAAPEEALAPITA